MGGWVGKWLGGWIKRSVFFHCLAAALFLADGTKVQRFFFSFRFSFFSVLLRSAHLFICIFIFSVVFLFQQAHFLLVQQKPARALADIPGYAP